MIINAVMGSNLFNTMFALVIVSLADLRKADAKRGCRAVKENEYVTAAEALGASRHAHSDEEIIPNSVSSVADHGNHDIGNKI